MCHVPAFPPEGTTGGSQAASLAAEALGVQGRGRRGPLSLWAQSTTESHVWTPILCCPESWFRKGLDQARDWPTVAHRPHPACGLFFCELRMAFICLNN